MVRISLPNRLKSTYSGSTSNSRSTSPNPASLKRSSTMDLNSEAKTSTLVLKVVVMKVRGSGRRIGWV